MADNVGLTQFALQVRSEVISEASGDGEGDSPAEFKENVFTRVVTGYLADIGAIDDAEVCYFARKTTRGHVKINAYYLDTETRALDLFVTHYTHSESPTRISKADVVRPLEQLIRYFRAASGGLYEQLEPAHDDFSMAQRIFECGEDVERIRCFYLTDGLSPVSSAKPFTVGDLKARCEIWDITRLFRATRADTPHETITIDFEAKFGSPLRCLASGADLKDYAAYVTIIPGAVLSELYDEYGSRLLELNVRSFLQARGKVNRGIRDTLKQAPERFLAYNNGISATAEEVVLTRLPDGHTAIREIKDLQIVNGGQTTASIHRAQREDKSDLSTVLVQAKISVVGPAVKKEFVPLISKYANSQNAVREADFSANDAFHIELERLSETTWCPGEQSRWFYERARGQYQVAKAREGSTPAKRKKFNSTCPASQKFEKTDVAKYTHSWEQLPHLVSRGSQKNFVEFMLRFNERDEHQNPDAVYYKSLVAKALLFKEAHRVVRSLKEEVPAYRANVVAYAVSYLARSAGGGLNLDAIWNAQEAPSAASEAFRQWAPAIYDALVASSAGRNVTEWAKKNECWKYIGSLDFELPQSLRSYLER